MIEGVIVNMVNPCLKEKSKGRNYVSKIAEINGFYAKPFLLLKIGHFTETAEHNHFET